MAVFLLKLVILCATSQWCRSNAAATPQIGVVCCGVLLCSICCMICLNAPQQRQTHRNKCSKQRSSNATASNADLKCCCGVAGVLLQHHCSNIMALLRRCCSNTTALLHFISP